MVAKHEPQGHDLGVLALLEAFTRGVEGAEQALPWANHLSLREREWLRRDLALVLSEPQETGEPLDWKEIWEILREGAETAGWEGVLVPGSQTPREGVLSVDMPPQDRQILAAAPSGVQRAVDTLLAEFLPLHPTDGARLPRGHLEKLKRRDVWQIELPDGYRLRYVVDKLARVVHIVYFGPHPAGDPRGREQLVWADVQRRRCGNR